MGAVGVELEQGSTAALRTAGRIRSRQLLTENGRSSVLVTRLGLRITNSLAYDSWADAGLEIARVHESSMWCLGDWIVYGQFRYESRYRHAVQAAGLDYQTIRNYAWVARNVELSRRREELSFQHHAEVAALPPDEQDYWLERAVKEKWSRNAMRKQIRGDRDRAGAPEAVEASDLASLQASNEQIERWRQAADRSRHSLREWILGQLDSAASQVLND